MRSWPTPLGLTTLSMYPTPDTRDLPRGESRVAPDRPAGAWSAGHLSARGDRMVGVADLPASLVVERRDEVAVLTLTRVEKRNALDDDTVAAIGRFFAAPPDWARVVVLAAAGSHFSAGL